MLDLLALFILVPLLDAWLLLRLAGVIGGWSTLWLVILTGALGAWLARLQGREVWRQWQQALGEGRVPEDGVLGGALWLLGGALLVTPGVITDAIGLLLLVPASRRLCARWLRPWLARRLKGASSRVVAGRRVTVVRVEGDGAHQETLDFDPVAGRRGPPADAPRRPEPFEPQSQPRPVIDVDFEVRDD